MTDHDIVIVGAGPVGLLLACELSLCGARPLLLDKRAEPGDLPKANGIGGQILDVLDHRGLLERLSAGSPFFGVPPGFPFGPVPLRFAGLDGIPLRMLMIQQPRLERLLGERAAELGVTVRRGREVTALAQDADGVTVEGPGFAVRARYAVGCDGGAGRVRTLAGIGFPGTTDGEVLRLGHFRAPGESGDPFADPGFAGLRPGWNRTPHGRLLITSLQPGVRVAGVRERGSREQDGPVTPAEFGAAVRRVLGRDLPLGEPIWLSSTVSQARLAERYRAGRVFLAGDAAHLFPAGGSALNVGLTDAVNLGWKLAAALDGRARPLDTYEAERRPAAARALTLTRAQAVLDRLTGEDAEALTAVLTEVFAFEQPARHLAALLNGSDVRYGDGAGHPLVGRLVPDLPLVPDAGGGARRVAELLRRPRFVLLHLAGELPADPVYAAAGLDVVRARCAGPPADALLIRPDGYVAWAGTDGLAEAVREWLAPVAGAAPAGRTG
ncbi:FAD-dependent monooxygenase [Actinomadura sp. ATCC 31491]|uniref:FAD-dependent monooxygenase n=1 Tax=Actinomadura luzonensis TaxID=2805427 RepID=A0ABT0FN90_9ACTN|nr:FAD-dependent monooxygenase [Actinomadura luzonensis]MCK2213767.1 FAD-dependent monooxygenase [Actinomadura luzonensis]